MWKHNIVKYPHFIAHLMLFNFCISWYSRLVVGSIWSEKSTGIIQPLQTLFFSRNCLFAIICLTTTAWWRQQNQLSLWFLAMMSGIWGVNKFQDTNIEFFSQVAHFSNDWDSVQGATAFMLYQYVLFTDVYVCI